MQQLSGQDAMFLYGEMDNTPMHIGPVFIYDPSTAPDGMKLPSAGTCPMLLGRPKRAFAASGSHCLLDRCACAGRHRRK